MVSLDLDVSSLARFTLFQHALKIRSNKVQATLLMCRVLIPVMQGYSVDMWERDPVTVGSTLKACSAKRVKMQPWCLPSGTGIHPSEDIQCTAAKIVDIKTLKANKSTGSWFPSKGCQDCLGRNCPHLLMVINQSLEEGAAPDQMIIYDVTPFHKKGSK